jgi:hypothetical protein
MNIKKIKQLAKNIENYQSAKFALKNKSYETQLKIEYLVAPDCYNTLSIDNKVLNDLILEYLEIEIEKIEQELKEEINA